MAYYFTLLYQLYLQEEDFGLAFVVRAQVKVMQTESTLGLSTIALEIFGSQDRCHVQSLLSPS